MALKREATPRGVPQDATYICRLCHCRCLAEGDTLVTASETLALLDKTTGEQDCVSRSYVMDRHVRLVCTELQLHSTRPRSARVI